MAVRLRALCGLILRRSRTHPVVHTVNVGTDRLISCPVLQNFLLQRRILTCCPDGIHILIRGRLCRLEQTAHSNRGIGDGACLCKLHAARLRLCPEIGIFLLQIPVLDRQRVNDVDELKPRHLTDFLGVLRPDDGSLRGLCPVNPSGCLIRALLHPDQRIFRSILILSAVAGGILPCTAIF